MATLLEEPFQVSLFLVVPHWLSLTQQPQPQPQRGPLHGHRESETDIWVALCRVNSVNISIVGYRDEN